MSVVGNDPEQEEQPPTRLKSPSHAFQKHGNSRDFTVTIEAAGGHFEVKDGALRWYADDAEAPPYTWGIPAEQATPMLENLLWALKVTK